MTEWLKEPERTAFLELAMGMFDCEISGDAELEVNEDIIEGIYFVKVTTETGKVLKFTVSVSAFEDLVKKFLRIEIVTEKAQVKAVAFGTEDGSIFVDIELPLFELWGIQHEP